MFIPGVTGKARCLSPTPEGHHHHHHVHQHDDNDDDNINDTASLDSGGNPISGNNGNSNVGSLERKLQMLKHRQLQEQAKKQHDESQEQFHEQLRRAHEEAKKLKSTKKKVFRDALDVSVHPNKLFHLSNHSSEEEEEEKNNKLLQVHPETPKSTAKESLDSADFWKQQSQSPKTMRDELDGTIFKAPQQQQEQYQPEQLLQQQLGGLGTLDEGDEEEGLSLDDDDDADGLDGPDLDGLDALEMDDGPLERPWEADDDYCFKPIVPPGGPGTLELEGLPEEEEEELEEPEPEPAAAANSGSKRSLKSMSSRSSSGSSRKPSEKKRPLPEKRPLPRSLSGSRVVPLSDELAHPTLGVGHHRQQQQQQQQQQQISRVAAATTMTPAQQQTHAKMVQNGLTSRSSRRKTSSSTAANAGQGTSIQKDLDLYLERKKQKSKEEQGDGGGYFSSSHSLQSEINFYIQQYKEQRGARAVERLHTSTGKESEDRVKFQHSYATLDSEGEEDEGEDSKEVTTSDDGCNDDDEEEDPVVMDTSASSTDSPHQSSSSLSTDENAIGVAPYLPSVRRKLRRQPRQVTLVKPTVPKNAMVKNKKSSSRKKKSSNRRRKGPEIIPDVIQGEVPSFLRRLGEEL